MADLNKVFLMGALTADPELRYTSGGTAVADLRLVTSRTWTGKEGERREDKLYIDITVWNRQAENCCQYLKKGRTIFVEGYLKLESWESPTGEKRSKVKVEAERVQFLDRKDDGGGGGGGYSADDDYSPAPAREQGPPRRATGGPSGGSRGYAPPRNASPAPPPRPPAPDSGDGEDDDIPF
ncbi:MAG: single-stranded DNA-binding protein [Isosphaeraceae bacterium]|nr:single-stranded DNA-binding protein [Isosphaeraceae bacterium]